MPPRLAPPGFTELLIGDTDPRGKVLRPPNTSLSQPGAVFDHGPDFNLTFEQTYRTHGSYSLQNRWSPHRCN
eukprot:COSAG01_NODE_71906_length_254_cov_1.000000_1_plen_71_part_01